MNLRDTYLGSLSIRKESIEELSLLEKIAQMDPVAILKPMALKSSRDKYRIIEGPRDLLARGDIISADDLKIWIDTRVPIPLVIYDGQNKTFEIYKVYGG